MAQIVALWQLFWYNSFIKKRKREVINHERKAISKWNL